MIRRFVDAVKVKLHLVAHVRDAGWRPAAPAIAVMATRAIVPAGIALATGNLVAKVVTATGSPESGRRPVLVALAVLIAFLLLDHTASALGWPLRKYMTSRINGELRGRVRSLLVGPSGLAHLEEQSTRDDAFRVTRGVTGRTIAEGVEAQIATWFSMVGAGVAAIVAATIAPELAAFVLASMIVMRIVLSKQVSGYVGLSASLTGQQRRGKYWIDVAGTAPYAKEVRLFGWQGWAVGRQFEEAERSRRPVFEGVDLFNKRQWKPFAIAAVGYGLPFVVLVVRATNGDVSPSELATIAPALAAIGMVGSPGFDMFFVQAAIPCVASLDRLGGLAAEPPGQGPSRVGETPVIRFERVSFRYPGSDVEVLNGLDLEIRPGQSLAVVGANGAGKTTLIKLLTRLYEPTSGRITADGVPLNEVPSDEWRRRLSVIFQDFVHYELSAAENVGAAELGRIDRGRLEAAARDAGADDLIAQLPGGWDSTLSRSYERGVEVSGGQWQRIALGRLLYGLHAGRRTLILDEPTANLDVQAETEVFERLLERAAGSTVVLISHRFSTVRRADRVAVLDGGRVVEIGTHHELLQRDGQYASMFHQQADRYLAEAAE